MNVVNLADQSAELERMAEHVDLHDDRDNQLEPGWSAKWLAALPDVSAAQTRVADHFIKQLRDSKLQLAWQPIESFVDRVYCAATDSGDDSLPVHQFAELLPLEALNETPRAISDAFASLRSVINARLRPIIDAGLGMAGRVDKTDDDYEFLDQLLGFVETLVTAVSPLLAGDLKLYADGTKYVARLADIERTIADAHDAMPSDKLLHYTERRMAPTHIDSLPALRLLASEQRFSLADFVRHAAVNGGTASRGADDDEPPTTVARPRSLLAAGLAAIFGTGVSLYLTKMIHATYMAMSVLDQLHEMYITNIDIVERSLALSGMVSSYDETSVDPTVAYAIGWIRLETKINMLGFEYVQRTPVPPGFITARSRFYATMFGYPRELLGASGALMVLIIIVMIVGFFRYRSQVSAVKAEQQTRPPIGGRRPTRSPPRITIQQPPRPTTSPEPTSPPIARGRVERKTPPRRTRAITPKGLRTVRN